MAIPIVVLEPAPAYRRGVLPALVDAGFDADLPEGQGRVVLAPLRAAADCAAVDRITADPGATVVALVNGSDPDAYAHALGHGAAAAVPWDAEPDRIAAVALAAAGGISEIPVEAARALARRGPDHHRDRPLLDPVEVSWIVELARGATVVGLAERAGYSERAMFRRLGEIYARLGAANRAEALVAAQRHGLLEPNGS